MHIPPYYKRASWQRFLAGAFLGAIIAFAVFIFMYGKFHERWVEENLKLRSELNQLQHNYKTLEESKKELDQKSKEDIKVQTIIINIENETELKLDSLIVHQLQEQIKEEINHVVGKSTSSLSDNYELLIATIENKTYPVDEFSYNAVVNQLFVTENLTVNVQLKIAN
ncbi:sporulation membrane protein YtrI [Aquibacillus rhizosphaerae]|uniref:Sporulation membrane protein YtrI C-terminal domain-containing protein n=1 Tax=Aquibacillus rhizosphaerae TaxID=3051431 RepID=A0ABT7L474_9BACI|nr:sporulation membrane protein YtrI [Aquibacillus sp. LR5S19]MDL4840671.1 hypothetical protein [Aquibacillus sp. LR5S19]